MDLRNFIPIRALLKRVNRRLAHDGRIMRRRKNEFLIESLADGKFVEIVPDLDKFARTLMWRGRPALADHERITWHLPFGIEYALGVGRYAPKTLVDDETSRICRRRDEILADGCPVTKRACIARAKRALSRKGLRLRKGRDQRVITVVRGTYRIEDVSGNVIESGIDDLTRYLERVAHKKLIVVDDVAKFYRDAWEQAAAEVKAERPNPNE